MLQLILGTSGSGKTHKIRELLREDVLQKNKKIVLLVPEQNSFENEKAMLNLLGAKDMNKIEILSFTRLADWVFRKVGGLCGQRLDDGGRHAIMNMALSAVKSELSLYRDAADKIDFIKKMTATVREFKENSVFPEQLEAAAAKGADENLSLKLRDTAKIFESYNRLISESYIDPLDDLTKLERALTAHNFFEGYTFYADGFHDFTRQQLKVIEQILLQAKDFYITLCTNADLSASSSLDVFSIARKTARRLSKIAEKNEIKILEPIVLCEQKRFKTPELKCLEKAVFDFKRGTYEKECENIFVYHAATLYEEAQFAANTIKKFVVEKGYRYKDFAVIVRSLDTYKNIFSGVFEKYAIPFFMNVPKKVFATPLMRLCIFAFEAVHNSFDSDAIFRYLKTGLCGLSTDEISRLENYVFLWQINGPVWHEEFEFHPEGFCEILSDDDKKILEELNALRERVILPLERFSARLKKGTGETFARALYLLLEEIDAFGHLQRFSEKLKQEEKFVLAEEQLRLWEMLVGLLEQTALILRENLPSRRYAELFELMVHSCDMSFIPKGLDEVTVGEANRVRLQDPKIVFIIGAVEGEFPKSPEMDSIFSSKECEALKKCDIDVYNSVEDSVLKERFLAYTSMTSPSQQLYVTWSSVDEMGASKAPSAIVREMTNIFKNLKVLDDCQINLQDKIWSDKQAFDLYAKHFSDGSVFSETLKAYFGGREDYSKKLEKLQNANDCSKFSFQDKHLARELFGNNLRLSASQIEKYYLCRFQYFCRYTLLAKERKPAAFDDLEYGSLMHYLLEHIFSQHDKDELANLSSAQIKTAVRALLEQYVEKKLGGWSQKTPRFRYLLFRLAETAQVLVSHIVKELLQSDFSPKDYEVDISKNGQIQPLRLKLADGGFVEIYGKVDRVDIMKKDGKNYVRIIDYKTGSKEFSLSDILYGLNMQMLLYLDAIIKNGQRRYGNVLPAGVLYMPANRPILDATKDMSQEALREKQAQKLKMSGLILEDESVIRGMEKEARGLFIPVAIKDGKALKSESVASLAQLGKIAKYIEELVVSMAQSLRAGDICATPLKGQYDSCEWCPYFAICGYEKDLPRQKIEKLSKREVLEKIAEKGEQNGGENLDA